MSKTATLRLCVQNPDPDQSGREGGKEEKAPDVSGGGRQRSEWCSAVAEGEE